MSWYERARATGHEVADQWNALRTLGQVGFLNPRRAVVTGRATAQWGPTSAAGYEVGAKLAPHKTAIIDDGGQLSFAEVDTTANALANALRERGVGPGESVAVLCRNGRPFVLAATALARIGAASLYLNTGFAGPQAKEVLEREGARAVIYDDEFAEMIEGHVGHLDLFVADAEAADSDRQSLLELVRGAPRTRPEPPERPGPTVILTSGTTGTPKGARRSTQTDAKGLVGAAGIFQMVPWRVGDVHYIAAPMFHALGGGALLIASQLEQTLICHRHFDPETVLRSIAEHQVTGLTVVPVMLQRILALPDEVIDRYDTSTLRVVHCSGSALPGSLALRWMDRFGDNLYNMFGSTEVAVATIAGPEDLRAAPGTAGRVLPGVEVRLYDDDDQPVSQPGKVGRIFVGSTLRFEGYTSGDTKQTIEGLLSIGDVGHFDDEGRLFVGGRDDDMIISGGENVFPREVEDLLADHPDIVEAAVVGVDDEAFGQRLAAFVVRREGADLDEAAVKAHVKANLASYKVPGAVTFVDELPRNPSGKVLKRELQG